MEPTTPHDDLNAKLAERFKALPKVVRDAITSADVQKHLRELANTHKLHLDQWQVLENEVMLTLLGFQETSELADNLKSDLDISADVAQELADDVSRVVFAPIRAELEHLLAHPDAQPATVSDVETARSEVLNQNTSHPITPAITPSTSTIIPATPPAPTPTNKAIRAIPSTTYVPQASSHERKTIEGDPYREQVS
jgi:hypothetical protein